MPRTERASSSGRTLRKISFPYKKAIIKTLILILLIITVFHVCNDLILKYNNPVCKVDQSVIMNGTVNKSGDFVTTGNKVYPEGKYFEDDGKIRVCQCLEKPCIRKCCRENEAFLGENCTEVDDKYFMTTERSLYRLYDDFNLMEDGFFSPSQFNVLYGSTCTENRFLLNHSYPSDVSYLMTNGSIFYLNVSYNTDSYCLENFEGDDETYVVICFEKPAEVTSEFIIYPVAMIISEPFLLITFLVYAFLPLKNLHGKCLMCHVSVLFAGYLSLIIVQLASNQISTQQCIVLAFIIQFSFLASFFWLNIMCFDIWWVFSGLRPLRGSPSEREHKKFIIYSIYAWGCPVIIFIITLIMQTVQSIPDTYTKPEFGVDKCWFKSNMATFLYFYLPIIILVVLNIIMFITTAFRLRAHTKETEVLKSGESNRHDENERQRFNLYLKLFIVMGVNWVMELISWLAGGPKSLWYVTDVTNTLQGVLIFLIFVWKPRILRLLNQKLCPSLQLVPASTSSTRSKVSPSRTTSSSLKQTSSNNTHPEPDRIGLKKMTSDESDAPA